MLSFVNTLTYIATSFPLPIVVSDALLQVARQAGRTRDRLDKLAAIVEGVVDVFIPYVANTLHYLRRHLAAIARQYRPTRQRSATLWPRTVRRIAFILLKWINIALQAADRPRKKNKHQIVLESEWSRFRPYIWLRRMSWFQRLMLGIMFFCEWLGGMEILVRSWWTGKSQPVLAPPGVQSMYPNPLTLNAGGLNEVEVIQGPLSRPGSAMTLRRRWSWPSKDRPGPPLADDADFVLVSSTNAVYDALADNSISFPSVDVYPWTSKPAFNVISRRRAETPPSGPMSLLATLGSGIPDLIFQHLLEGSQSPPMPMGRPPSYRGRWGHFSLPADAVSVRYPFPGAQPVTLVAFGLVCRDWYSIFLRQAYSCVALSLTPNHVQVANKIATDEDFRAYITRLRIEASARSSSRVCTCSSCWGDSFAGGSESISSRTSGSARSRRRAKVAAPLLRLLPLLPNLKYLEYLVKGGGGTRALNVLSKNLRLAAALEGLAIRLADQVTHPKRKFKIGQPPPSPRWERLSPRVQDDLASTMERLLLALARQGRLQELSIDFRPSNGYRWHNSQRASFRIPTTVIPRYRLRKIVLSGIQINDDLDIWWILGSSADTLRHLEMRDCVGIAPWAFEEALEYFGRKINHLSLTYVEATVNGGGTYDNIVTPLESLVSLYLCGLSFTDQVLRNLHPNAKPGIKELHLNDPQSVLPSVFLATIVDCPQLEVAIVLIGMGSLCLHTACQDYPEKRTQKGRSQSMPL